jgi:selenium-binding protein 1
LLAKWDKKEAEDEHFLKLYKWDGTELKHEFTVDFVKEELGRPHDMKFGTVSAH